MLMGSHDGTVDKDFFKIGIACQLSEHPIPYALPRAPGKALIHAIPQPKFTGQITPRAAGTSYPKDGFDKQTLGRFLALGYPLRNVC